MAYTNWAGRAAHYGNLSEIKKRAKFDIDKTSDLLGMVQQGSAILADESEKYREKKGVEAYAIEELNLTPVYEEKSFSNLWHALGKPMASEFTTSIDKKDESGNVIGKDVFTLTPSQVKWYGEKGRYQTDGDFNMFLSQDPIKREYLETKKDGSLKDTELVHDSEGDVIAVNEIEESVYADGNEQLVDEISGDPLIDEDGNLSQNIDPSAATSLTEAAGTMDWASGGKALMQGGQGATSGDQLKSIGMSAAMAVNPVLGIGLMAADWIYGAHKQAEAAREQIGQLEDGVDAMNNSLSKAQNVLSEKTQSALGAAENKIDSLISGASNQLGGAAKTVESAKKRSKGLSTGVGESAVTDLASSIQESLTRDTEAISDATYASIGDIGRSGAAEIENIGFQVDSFKDQIETLEGQDSTWEQMFGSDIGGWLDKKL